MYPLIILRYSFIRCNKLNINKVILPYIIGTQLQFSQLAIIEVERKN